MIQRLSTVEKWGYLIAFLVALLIRFSQLGAASLSDPEAALAWQALHLVRAEDILLTAQPGYTLVTSILFFLFGDSNLTARIVPALLGSLLVFLPLFFSGWLDRGAALFLAFGLAIDPGLVAISRSASGVIWVIFWIFLGTGYWKERKPIGAGISFGLALLGGSSLFVGLVPLLIAWIFVRAVGLKPDQNPAGQTQPLANDAPFLRSAGFWALGSFLIGGTLFFLHPSGIGAAFDAFPEYLSKWSQSSGTSSIELITALIVYAPLPVFLSVLQVVYGIRQKQKVDLFLGAWALIALFVQLIMPGRGYDGLVWMMLPAWALTARFFARLGFGEASERNWILSLVVLQLTLLTFAWVTFLSLNAVQQPEELQIRQFAIIAAVIVLLLSGLLIGWGWSRRVAWHGLVWASSLFLLVFTLAGTFQVRDNDPRQLWNSGHTIQDADLIIKSIDQLSRQSFGTNSVIDGIVAGIDSPALNWLLRNYPGVMFAANLTNQVSPSMVITREADIPSLLANYRGTRLTLREQVEWDNLTPSEWRVWIASREAPIYAEQVIVWGRVDLFPGE